MKRILLSLAVTSVLAIGCGRGALEARVTTLPAAEKAAAAPEESAPKADDDVYGEAAAAPADQAPAGNEAARMPGDFVVYRFTGSFRKGPLTLSQKVLDRQGSILTLAVVAEEKGKKTELRVQLDDAAPGKPVLGVAKVEDGVAKKSTVAAYEELMAKTALAADQNEAFVGSEEVLVDVGGSKVPAKKATYRVRIGKKQATLKTVESAQFAWGDVGGEITGDTGKLLYKAEVLESGHADPNAKHGASAALAK